MSQSAACACGQVLFDVGDKKPNDALTCPWCSRKYRYLGDGKVEPFDAPAKPPSAKDSQKKKAEKKSEPDDKAEPKKPDAPKAAEVPKKADPDKKPRLAGTAKHDPMALEGRHSNRKRRSKEIPGGVGVMVGFIVAFNAAAFIALKLGLPAQTDGTRLLPWGAVVPKAAIWPEIAALLAGHFVGFFAWTTYLYFRQQKLKDQAALAAVHSPLTNPVTVIKPASEAPSKEVSK